LLAKQLFYRDLYSLPFEGEVRRGIGLKGKVECRPFADFPLRPDPAAMAVDDAMNDGHEKTRQNYSAFL
jgi:hypothetical protein